MKIEQKILVNKYNHQYYIKNKVRLNQIHKSYNKKNRKHLTKTSKIWRHQNSDKVNFSTKKWKSKNNEKVKAHTAVNHAIRDGILPDYSILACENCSEEAEIFHHFMGYSIEHRLDVMPLCRQCHFKIENEVI